MQPISVLKRAKASAYCVSIASLSLAQMLGGIADAQANQDPYINGTPAASAPVGEQYDFVPSAGDADGDAVNFTIWNKPEWATFSNGRLSGTPTAAGTWAGIEIWADDGQAWTRLGPFSIEVNAAVSNRAPTITGTASATGKIGQAYSFKPVVSDADGDAVNLAIWNKPAWATFSNGVLSGTPTTTGTWSGIEIWADDGYAWTRLQPFSIQVQVAAANVAPKIAGVPSATATVGTVYSFTAVATDANNDKLTFSIASKPAWATFANGVLSGTPAAAGTWSNIIIRVSDGKLSAALPPFSIKATVAPAGNRAPTITGTPPATVKVGQPYSFKPVSADPDGDKLNLQIWNKPSWAAFANGVLSGTPTSVGTWSGIEIWVDDGRAWTLLPAFSIQATAAQGAPMISGTPPTAVAVGSAYSFRPTASDPDGDTLYFSVANKPVWATFSTTTGVLSGTPSAARAGNYPGVTITVTDGKLSASLAPFAIAVATQPAPTGSATLSWSPPTQNVDGSELSNLAGYRIYYGTSASSMTQVIDLTDPAATNYVVGQLSPSTVYFALKAYTADGGESVLSNIASKTIQ